MKKFLVVAVTLAMVCLSSAAFAVEVTVNGEIDIRSRLFENFDLDKRTNNAYVSPTTGTATGDTRSRTTTETRYLLDVNVKASDTIKGKLSIWNDHDTWGQEGLVGGVNTTGTSGSGRTDGTKGTSNPWIREAWIDFMVPGTPVGIKAGHQLMQIGNGWFMRDTYGGRDAWIVYAKQGDNLFTVLNVKVNEVSKATGAIDVATGTTTTVVAPGAVNTNSDDVDLYTAMAAFKLPIGTANINLSMLKDDAGTILTGKNEAGTALLAPGLNAKGRLYNLGLNFDGKIGAATIKAEIDLQQGSLEGSAGSLSYSGNQVVIQGSLPIDKLTVNATLARGSGDVANVNKKNGFVNMLDIGQHYTLIYEYRLPSAANATNQGFENTTALNIGAMYQVAKSLAVGADLWFLQATELTNVKPVTGATVDAASSRDAGKELDVKVNWTISPNLSWNWQLGYFLPGAMYNGAGYQADAAWGAQGVLSLKF